MEKRGNYQGNWSEPVDIEGSQGHLALSFRRQWGHPSRIKKAALTVLNDGR